ncbi:MAG: aminodeoxychorismate/anthranilate synthase component II [Deltaproteobacteria bacterium]|nr:aminodeoxychorismate/anthranilate synthase component II [Deltaproteobacteria bacterium]
MTLVCLLDHKDSFTFNLVQAFQELAAEVDVVSSEELEAQPDAEHRLARILSRSPQLVCLGPGPHSPEKMPALVELTKALIGRVPLFGVCLGMQAIHLVSGGKLKRATRPIHGERSEITHDGKGLFSGLPSPLWVMRYHSLVLDDTVVAPNIDITARCEDGQPMALHDVNNKVFAVQFHPESIGTSGGGHILRKALKFAGGNPPWPPQCERPGALLPPQVKGARLDDVLYRNAFATKGDEQPTTKEPS